MRPGDDTPSTTARAESEKHCQYGPAATAATAVDLATEIAQVKLQICLRCGFTLILSRSSSRRRSVDFNQTQEPQPESDMSQVDGRPEIPTAEGYAELSRSMRALSVRFGRLEDDYDTQFRDHKDQMSIRDKVEFDLRKQLSQAHKEIAHLQGERDAYIRQLGSLKPREERPRASSDVGRSRPRSRPPTGSTGLHANAAARPNARPRSQTPGYRQPWRRKCYAHARMEQRPAWCRYCEEELRKGPQKCPNHQDWKPRPRWCSRCLEEWRG